MFDVTTRDGGVCDGIGAILVRYCHSLPQATPMVLEGIGDCHSLMRTMQAGNGFFRKVALVTSYARQR